MMMMKSVIWWRKPEYPEETTDLRQVTEETFHTYGLCPVRGLNLGHSDVMQSELRRDESDALAHRATAGVRRSFLFFLLSTQGPKVNCHILSPILAMRIVIIVSVSRTGT